MPEVLETQVEESAQPEIVQSINEAPPEAAPEAAPEEVVDTFTPGLMDEEPEDEELTDVDLALEDSEVVVPIDSERDERTEQAQRSAITSLIEEDPVFRYNTALATSPMISAGRGIARADVEIATMNRMLMDEAIKGGIEDAGLAAEDITARADVKAQLNANLVQDYAVIDQWEGAEFLPPERRVALATDLFISRRLSEIMTEAREDGFWGDLAGIFFVSDESWNYKELFQAMELEGNPVLQYISSGEMTGKLGITLRQLPPAEKIAAFTSINKLLMKIDDNDTQRSNMLSELFMGTEGDIITPGVSQGMDKVGASLDTASIAGWAAKGILFAAALPFMIRKGLQIYNKMHTLSEAGESERLAQVSDIASRSGEGARAFGVDQLDAANIANPAKDSLTSILTGTPEGPLASSISNLWARNDAVIKEGLNVIDEGVGLSAQEKTVAAAKREEAFLSMQANMTEAEKRALDMEGVVFEAGEAGIKMSYTKLGKGSEPTKVIENINYTVNDIVGGYKLSNGEAVSGISGFKAIASYLISPNTLLRGNDNLIDGIDRMIKAQGKVKSGFVKAQEEIWKGTSKKERANVGAILQQGNLKGKQYNLEDLRQGKVLGLKLNDKELRAYAGSRQLMDQAYYFKNQEMYNGKTAKGYQKVDLGDGASVEGVTYMDMAQAWDKVRGKAIYQVENPEKALAGINQDELARLYNQGYRIIETDVEDAVSLNKSLTRYVLSKPQGITDIDFVQIERSVGYVPIEYKDARWFGEEVTVKTIDGVDTEIVKATHYFTGEGDARKWEGAQAMSEAKTYRVRYDRESVLDPTSSQSARIFGKMYTSSRGKERLKFGSSEADAEFLDPLEAMSRYMDNIANRLPMAQFRVGIENRWVQHARAFYPEISANYVAAKGEILAGAGNMPESQRTMLVAAAGQIDVMLKVPTTAEKTFQSAFENLANAASKKSFLGERIPATFYKVSEKSVPDALKSASFHLLLGRYNASQLLVQGFNASVSASMNPKMFARGFKNYDVLQVTDMLNNPLTKKGYLESLPVESQEIYRLWEKSGMLESILATSTDFNGVLRGHPYDKNTLRRLMDNQTFFFKQGELISMRNSFLTATEWYKDANKLPKDHRFTDEDLRKIMVRVEDYRLRMGSANKAAYQKGYMGVTSQFMQVQAKHAETFFNPNFTGWERARYGAFNLLTFGSASIPFSRKFLEYQLKQAGYEPGDFTENETLFMSQGLSGLIINGVLGLDVKFTGRLALGGEAMEGLYSTVFEPSRTSAAEFLLGPSSQLVAITGTTWDTLLVAGQAAVNINDLPPGMSAQIYNQAYQLAVELAGSGGRNLQDALDIYLRGFAMDSKGRKYVTPEEQRKSKAMWSLAGFRSQEQHDRWLMKAEEKITSERKTEKIDAIVRTLAKASRVGEEKQQAVYSFLAASMLNDVPDQTDRDAIWKGVLGRLSPEDEIGKFVSESHLRAITSMNDSANMLQPLLAKKAEELRGRN